MKKHPTENRKRSAAGAGATGRVTIERILTGVRGFDEILGGGIPKCSFNIIAGTPGGGKTPPAHQIVFANAPAKKPALYFTVVGEPALKMLRYQQQFSFFDKAKIGKAVRFINLADVLLENGLKAVLTTIIKQVQETSPGIVVVDSFRTVVRTAAGTSSETELQAFLQSLAQFLTSWQATTFLVGEYAHEEMRDNPLFTIADGLIWLWQVTERNSVVRKLQIMKLRGQASVPGLHTIRIGNGALQAFSRTLGLGAKRMKPTRRRLLSIGIPELDKMMGGGILEGDSVLIAGPSGTGKSALATQFIAEGLRNGEPGIMAIFEERPEGYTNRADSFGLDLTTAQ